MIHTLTFSEEELVTLHDSLCVHKTEIEQHWRYYRNKEPHYIKDRDDCEALRQRIEQALKEKK